MKEPITTNQDNREKEPIEFTYGMMQDGECRSCLQHSRPQQPLVVVGLTCHFRPHMSQSSYTVRAGGANPHCNIIVASIIGRCRRPCTEHKKLHSSCRRHSSSIHHPSWPHHNICTDTLRCVAL
eukprot:scaffold279972_cov32-Attheya_sp.AAC.1